MLEVLEIVSKTLLLFFLFVIAYRDYKTGLLEVRQLLIVGILGVFLSMGQGEFYQALTGIAVGVLVLLAAWCSKERIGFGDGWLFVVTGIFLGFLENFMLLFWTFILAGIFAAGCLALKKKGRNDNMALGPFVLAAYVMFIL